MTNSALARGVLAFTLVAVLAGCGKDEESPSAPSPGASDRVIIETFGTPQVTYDEDNKATNVVVQFVVRDGQRVPLADENLEIELQIDGDPIDVEFLLAEDAETLASSLHLTLVLDTSYSMTQHTPPAYLPMLSSARRTTSEGKSLYVERPGTFEWDLVWFNEVIYRPLETTPSTQWLETDIERIPSSDAGTFTKLYAAVKSAIESSAAHRASTNATARDQHLVVVFSDGADNYSWADNSNRIGSGSIGTARDYTWTGATPVSRADVEDLLAANPAIQLHAMGLGSAVDDEALSSLAAEGRGRYVKNVDPANVDVLFDEVTREFTSLQTRGVTAPLPPGEYMFSVVVRRSDTGSVSKSEFRFRGGAVDARVLD